MTEKSLIERSIWIGVEEDLDAVWVGEETAEGCARFGLPDVDPTAAVDTVINTVDDTAKDVVEIQVKILTEGLGRYSTPSCSSSSLALSSSSTVSHSGLITSTISLRPQSIACQYD